MPTPREPNLTDRLLDLGRGKISRRERELLAAAKPPGWVRLVFGIIFGGLTVAFLIALVGKFASLPWAPPIWPAWSLIGVSIILVQFVQREVYRQYGKRTLHGQQDPE